MGSSAQNSSGVHWCRRRVRFNEVPEKVPKVPEKVWEALVQSQVRFNRVLDPEKVGRLWCKARSGSTGFRNRFRRRSWEALVQSQVKFNRVPKKVAEKVGGFGAEPSSSTWRRARPDSTGFWRRFRRRLRRGFGAKPGQVQQVSGEGSGESRGGFGAEPGQVQQGSGEVSSAWLRSTLQKDL